MINRPFYNRIYTDMIREKYPEKEILCQRYLKKKKWNMLDVVRISELLFENERNHEVYQIDNKHRAYDESSIREMLEDQKKNKLNNTQLANKYGLSRNTVAKWKKAFEDR